MTPTRYSSIYLRDNVAVQIVCEFDHIAVRKTLDYCSNFLLVEYLLSTSGCTTTSIKQISHDFALAASVIAANFRNFNISSKYRRAGAGLGGIVFGNNYDHI